MKLLKNYSQQKVVVLTGGCSLEHDVSLVSAKAVYEALCKGRHEISVAVLSKEGRCYPHPLSLQLLENDTPVTSAGLSFLQTCAYLKTFDVVFPLIHGSYGEDGRLQGLLDYLQMPYVGCGIRSSVVCMDKGFTRDILVANRFPVPKYVVLAHQAYSEHQTNGNDFILKSCQELKFPVFVKPCNFGSSVGINKVKEPSELISAVMHAFSFDRRVIVEEAVDKARELEVAVYGTDEIMCSTVGEITYTGDFYDYETKYKNHQSQLHIPAAIDKNLQEHIQSMAKKVYQSLDCAGCARVDFFYEEAHKALYVNEINTMPGFTAQSMYPKLWDFSDINMTSLCDNLIHVAINQHLKRHLYD
jgi:D-alanine-D-alanine ligase